MRGRYTRLSDTGTSSRGGLRSSERQQGGRRSLPSRPARTQSPTQAGHRCSRLSVQPPRHQPQAEDWTLLRQVVLHPVAESKAATSISANVGPPGDARRRRKVCINEQQLAQWTEAMDFQNFEVDIHRGTLNEEILPGLDTSPTWVSAASRDQDEVVEISLHAKLSQLFSTMIASQHFECSWRLCQGRACGLAKHATIASVNNVDIDGAMNATTPPEFLLPLLPHQSRSLAWMAMREKICDMCVCEHQRDVPIAHLGSDMRIELRVDEAYSLRGGLLCDPVGSGKTATVLALICRERTSSSPLPLRLQTSGALFVTSATLILCPANVHEQWLGEVNKFCPDVLRVIALRTLLDLSAFSADDIMGADMVIAPYDLFTDSSDEAPYMLKDLCWHRVVLDEFHEICSQRASVDPTRNRFIIHALRSLEVGRRWGLSGTPRAFLESVANTVRAARCFRCDVSARTAASFVEHFCRQSRVELPIDTEEKVINVSHTPAERAVYLNQQYETRLPMVVRWADLKAHSAKTQRALLLCSHFNIDPEDTTLNLTAEDICNEILKKKSSAIDFAKQELSRLLGRFWHDIGAELELMPTLDKFMDHCEVAQRILEEGLQPELQWLQGHVKMLCDFVGAVVKAQEQLVSSQQAHKFFKRTWEAVSTSSEQVNCPICLEDVETCNIYILHCGHSLCHDCVGQMQALGHASLKCPVCRCQVSDIKAGGGNVRLERFQFSMVCPGDKAVVKSRAHWSSKLRCVVGAVESIHAQDPGAKIILFMQWDVIRRHVSTALNQVGLRHVSLMGDIFDRTRVLEQFRTDAEIPLLLLSLEDSASGTNLTMASHVFLLHPMLASSHEESVSFEAQAIGRVRRLGQTRTVHVWRFVTFRTVEEMLWGLTCPGQG